MEHSNSKEKEVIVDIDSVEASLLESHEKTEHAPNEKPGRKISLNRLVSGVLGFKGSVDDEPGTKSDSLSRISVDEPNETTGLLANQNPDMPPVLKDQEKERRKGGKGRKASKPPRPPKGPSLDAADMRLIKEISKIAMKKRERMERIKAVKKMKAARSPSSPSSSFSSSMGGTISAMVITILFFLVLIFQGLSSSNNAHFKPAVAPQPAPERTGLTPVQFYKTVMSDDGAAPSFIPPRSAQ